MVEIHKLTEDYKLQQIAQKDKERKEEEGWKVSFEEVIKKPGQIKSSVSHIPLISGDSGEDRVTISEDAKKAYELLKMVDIVRGTPNIREEKISLLREKLKKGTLFSAEANDIIADNIIRTFQEKFG